MAVHRREFVRTIVAASATLISGCGGGAGSVATTAAAPAVSSATSSPVPLNQASPPRIIGLAVYRVSSGRLDGTWTVNTPTYAGKTGIEIATGGPPNQIAGTYNVLTYSSEGVLIYSGTLTVAQVGPTFQLAWTGAKGNFQGLGLLAPDGSLAANYWNYL